MIHPLDRHILARTSKAALARWYFNPFASHVKCSRFQECVQGLGRMSGTEPLEYSQVMAPVKNQVLQKALGPALQSQISLALLKELDRKKPGYSITVPHK